MNLQARETGYWMLAAAVHQADYDHVAWSSCRGNPREFKISPDPPGTLCWSWSPLAICAITATLFRRTGTQAPAPAFPDQPRPPTR